ncbi:LOW QUALITY PROTEIN: hypothetical protein PHMEG_00017507 [Phytophthora megakarya]|uniref:Uncharacterized protein n=1 Tax=Phytophthora megakarya TaxID=4795 RepID=A0A225VY97_9STRA|nr:LOW QUALITY PROTEIN: hypothetical protein PHMEG_00017507 [Phytophthora megakarya]
MPFRKGPTILRITSCQLPLKTRRIWKLLSDAFIKYYCSKYNQVAKARYYSAKRVRFENGGREFKDLVEHVLVTCDDRRLEERLCHVRVKDIHDLEDMFNAILKRRVWKPKRDSSVSRSSRRRRDSSQNEDPRRSYRRYSHYGDDRRTESPYRSRITLADALTYLVTALNKISGTPQTSQLESYEHRYGTNEDSFGDGERRDNDDRYSNGGSGYDDAVEEERDPVAAANNLGHHAAAEGMSARSDNRRTQGDGSFNNDKSYAHENRNGRQQYGSCAACGVLALSVRYCYKCKQVHDDGKYKDFTELTSLLRVKVDKKDLTLMLQRITRQLKPDRETGFVNTTEIVEENDICLGQDAVDDLDGEEPDVYLAEALASGWGSNFPEPRSNGETAARREIRAVVIPTIRQTEEDSHGCGGSHSNEDSGANVSLISAMDAKRLGTGP